MKAAAVFLLATMSGAVAAQSIFNVSPSQFQTQQRPAQAQIIPTPQAGGLPSPAAPGRAPAPSLVDPKVMAQFDQLPNESNEAYLNRLKSLSQRAVEDMERISREHTAKMKALAPK